jgi:hypothetical protein
MLGVEIISAYQSNSIRSQEAKTEAKTPALNCHNSPRELTFAMAKFSDL